jgi:hypothetical protein
VIDCGHFFCFPCIQKWAEIENSCPYCKQEFTRIVEKRVPTKTAAYSESATPGVYKRRAKMSMKRGGRTEKGTTHSYMRTRSHKTQSEPAEDTEHHSGDPQSEVVKVVEVAKKKQRVNDAYAEDMDGEDLEDDYDDEYYDDEDYDDESMEMMTGVSNDLIVRLHNVTDADEDDEDFPSARASALYRKCL